MSIFGGLRKFLGMEKATLLEGYQSNPRDGNMPVCERCGTLVSYESQLLHRDWHAQGLR